MHESALPLSYGYDYGNDTLSMEVGDEKIEFNFYDAMKYPYSNVYSITCYDQVDKCV
jgi:hypothetical protein